MTGLRQRGIICLTLFWLAEKCCIVWSNCTSSYLIFFHNCPHCFTFSVCKTLLLGYFTVTLLCKKLQTSTAMYSPFLLPPPFSTGSGRVNLVPLPSVVTSPRDMALAAVICSALATVVLALLVLCVIYCKRQLLEKKPSGESEHLDVLRHVYKESELLNEQWLD